MEERSRDNILFKDGIKKVHNIEYFNKYLVKFNKICKFVKKEDMSRLRRVSDGQGDVGFVRIMSLNEDGSIKETLGGKPIVGCVVWVGSVTARSYSNQDYWVTSAVMEILEEREDYCRFRTENSEYELFY